MDDAEAVVGRVEEMVAMREWAAHSVGIFAADTDFHRHSGVLRGTSRWQPAEEGVGHD